METHNHTPHYKRVKDICVDMYTRDVEVEKQLLRGRVLLNTDKGELMFSENAPRGARSKEIYRTSHARAVRRPDGLYTFTFSMIDVNEKLLREQLLAELRAIIRVMKDDVERKGGVK